MRYHEVQRYQMELKQLVDRYKASGLEHNELADASNDMFTRLTDGLELFDDAETEQRRAADYELSFYEAKKHREERSKEPSEVIT